MNRWDIYRADVRFEDSDQIKERPIVILNDQTAFIVGLGIYSHSPRPYEQDYMIREWKAAGLDHQSTIELGRLIQIDKTSVKKKIGSLSLLDVFLIERILYR